MRQKTAVLLVFILAKFILQYLLISPEYDLHRDEYLHLDQGQHLAWGYISVPPLTSWFSWIIYQLGNGVFWIKFIPALFGALTLYIVWKMIESLGGDLFSQSLGALAILFSVILRINILYQPNSFDIFFWTLTYYIVIRYIQNNKAKWLLLLGICLGFGFLSKYNISFLVLGLIPAVAISHHRKIFLNPDFYLGIGITALIVLPNLIWQFRNDFPTVNQLKELTETQLVNVNRLDFVREQFLFFLGSLFIIFAAFIALLSYRPFREFRFILLSYIFSIALFIYFKAKGYYAVGLYPVLIAFGSVYLEDKFSIGWKRYLRPASLLVVSSLAILLLLLAFPYLSPERIKEKGKLYRDFGLLRWEDGKDHDLPQDFADMIGWSDLARKVDSVYNGITDKEHTLVFCDNYGQAGAINYYSKNKNINAVSMNADYINWIQLDKPIKNIIMVKDQPDEDPDREREKKFFKNVTAVAQNDNIFSREYGTKIYLLETATTDINSILRSEIEKRK